jgi:hypothetical protein
MLYRIRHHRPQSVPTNTPSLPRPRKTQQRITGIPCLGASFYPQTVTSCFLSARLTNNTSTCNKRRVAYLRRVFASRKTNHFLVFSLYPARKPPVLTVTHLTKTRGPRLTANWNSGDRSTTYGHAEGPDYQVTPVLR